MGIIARMGRLFKRCVRVVFHDAKLTYDGADHELPFSVDGLPDGFSLCPLQPQVFRHATSSPVEIDSPGYRVTNASGRDVTRWFIVEEQLASMTIDPKPLTVRSGSASKPWDGLSLVCAEVHVEGLAGNEGLAVQAVGALVDEGSIPNAIVIDWSQSSASESDYEVSLIPGELSVAPAPLLGVEAIPVEVLYDGLPHGFDIKVPKGASLTIPEHGVFIDAGEYSCAFEVACPHHLGVHGTASLRILPRPLRVACGSACKYYDGKPLRCGDVSIDGAVPGDTVTAVAQGELSDVGAVENRPVIDWGSSSAKKENYQVEYVNGYLYVVEGPSVIHNMPTDREPAEAGRVENEPPEPAAQAIKAIDLIEVARSAAEPEEGNGEDDNGASVETLTLPETFVLEQAETSVTTCDVGDDLVPVVCGVLENEGANGGDTSVELATDFTSTDRESAEAASESMRDCKEDCKEDYEGEGSADGFEQGCGGDSEDAGEGSLDEDSDEDSEVDSEDDSAGNRCSNDFDGNREDVFDEDRNAADGSGVSATVLEAIEPPAPAEQTCEATGWPEPIRIVTIGGRFRYDGKEHGAYVEPPVLPEGLVLKRADSLATVSDVEDGLVPATCDILVIEDAAGNDVTAELNVVYCDSALSIEPCPLSVMTYDARKNFDGLPLTDQQGRVVGLVNGETVTLTVTGTQTDVGQSENTAELVFDGSAKPGNYCVREAFGTLTVLEAPTVAPESPIPPTSIAPVAPVVPVASPPVLEETPVIWRVPSSRPVGDYGPATRSRKRYAVTPLEDRPDLDEMGLGRRFEPYPSLGSGRPIGDSALARQLRDFESRAHDAIEDMLDECPNGLLFQCYGSFAADGDELLGAFKRLFEYFRCDKRYALVYVHKHCQCAFLMYVALLVRTYSDVDSIWPGVFREVGGTKNRSQAFQQRFKRMFISYLYKRHMPVFESNEDDFYMARTACLHSGFSQDVWKVMWESAFIPMAEKDKVPVEEPGLEILSRAVDLISVDSLRERRVKEMLEKGPSQAMAIVCQTALRVARQVTDVSRDSRAALISSFGLSDMAMTALIQIVEAKAGLSEREKKQHEVMYLDEVKLALRDGAVCLIWGKAQLPSSLAGSRVDFYVNGEFRESAEITRMATHARLDAGQIELKPCAQYDVEMRLMAPSTDESGNETFAEKSSLFQSFQNSRPGCYEFIRDAHGQYRFRGRGQRITRKRRVAYLISDGLSVEGRYGMELVNVSPCDGLWESMKTFEFDVEPGASGVIVEDETHEIVAAWREDYQVRLDKSKVIGKAGRLDVYGHAIGTGETDVALPTINLSLPEGAPADDVEVRFVRDGREGVLDANWVENETSGVTALSLTFPSAEEGRGLAKACSIEARQKSTGDLLLKYRFAIVPLQGFRLVDCKIRERELIGVYGFAATESVTVMQAKDRITYVEEVEAGKDGFIEAKLKDETVQIAVSLPSGDSMKADLYLAGVDVEVDPGLLDAAEESPVNLATMRRISARKGTIKITTRSPRRGRAMVVLLGSIPLMNKTLDKASDTSFNLFERKSLFKPSGDCIYEAMPLKILMHFGYEPVGGRYEKAAVEYDYLRCEKGLGFTSCNIRSAGNNSRKYTLCFDVPAGLEGLPCDLHVSYGDGASHTYGECIVCKGMRRIDLPASVADIYDKPNSKVFVTVSTMSLFGGPNPDDAITIQMQRGKKGVVR